jgi:selenocysteine lyase/cysteine desulfurase
MGGGKSKYIANFEFVGTIDNAPYLCIPAAIKWRKSIGGEKVIMDYCQRLAKEGAVYVAKELGTEVLDNSTETLSQCCLTNVRLPTELATAHGYAGRGGIEASEVGFAVRDWIHRTLIDDYATFIQFVFYDGVWWARFSGQVYLEMKDFEWAAQTLKEICARVEKGEWVGKGSKL